MKIYSLFEYFGLAPLEIQEAIEVMGYWSFVESLADYLEKHDKLTEKQYEALGKQIDKRLGYEIRAYGIDVDYSVRKSHLYSQENPNKTDIVRTPKVVAPDYKAVPAINTYDLPFEDGKEYNIEIWKYSKALSILLYNKKHYKIPSPGIEDGKHKVQYKRTKCKGFVTVK